jgi:hypothetical protein
MEKPSLQSKFTFLKSKFFPAKIHAFQNTKAKSLLRKILLCKGTKYIKNTLCSIEVKNCPKYTRFHGIFFPVCHKKYWRKLFGTMGICIATRNFVPIAHCVHYG